MTPRDLKTGDRVSLRNGDTYVVLKTTSLGDLGYKLNGTGSISLSAYDDFMRIARDPYNKPWGEDHDIVRVSRPCNPQEILSPNTKAVITLWDEDETPLIPADAMPDGMEALY